jgi:hypothetical protein
MGTRELKPRTRQEARQLWRVSGGSVELMRESGGFVNRPGLKITVRRDYDQEVFE